MDSLAAANPLRPGVPAGGGFAVGSTRTGTQGGVRAIGDNLRGAGHQYLLAFIVS